MILWYFTYFKKNLFFGVSGLEFTTAPSVIAKEDGFSYITGCIYTLKIDVAVDLARFSYLIINNNTTVKLTGSSRRINPTTFQLPESRFIIPGNYQCVIESLNKFYKESMVSEIPMPGKHAEKISQILLSFLVCKNFKKRMILTL